VFRGLISDAKAAAGAVIVKYVARASVAVPFLVAAGFATAAITVMLVDRFGALTAYWALAGGFTAIGLVATLVVTVKEQEEEVVAEAKAAEEPSAAANAAAEVAMQAPLAVLSGLLATPLGPSSALGLVKVLARNLPLVLLLVMLGFLVWPREPGETEGEDAADADAGNPARRPNGVYTPDEVRA
jgi:hypothetical protein